MLRMTGVPLLAGVLASAMLALTGCDPCNGGPGTICTWAGTGEAAFNGDGLDRSETSFYWPMKVRFSPDGKTTIVMDWNNHRVRTVGADDKFQTIIGNENIGDGPEDKGDLQAPGVDGHLVNLNHPTDFAFMPDGTGILASWHNHKIRTWDPKTNLVVVLAGRGNGFKGDGENVAGALLDQPHSVLVDSKGDLYIADQRNQRIRRVRASDHVIETVAGNGMKAFGGDGGDPLAASFSFPAGSNPQPGEGIVMDADGKLYVADTENNRVRVIDFTAKTINTVAGTGEKGFSGDGGKATEAKLSFPRDVAIGPDGNLYIADTENHAIRKVDLSSGNISTVVGQGGAEGFAGDGAAAEKAKLARPFGITFDSAGNLFVADTFNNRIRRVAAWGK